MDTEDQVAQMQGEGDPDDHLDDGSDDSVYTSGQHAHDDDKLERWSDDNQSLNSRETSEAPGDQLNRQSEESDGGYMNSFLDFAEAARFSQQNSEGSAGSLEYGFGETENDVERSSEEKDSDESSSPEPDDEDARRERGCASASIYGARYPKSQQSSLQQKLKPVSSAPSSRSARRKQNGRPKVPRFSSANRHRSLGESRVASGQSSVDYRGSSQGSSWRSSPHEGNQSITPDIRIPAVRFIDHGRDSQTPSSMIDGEDGRVSTPSLPTMKKRGYDPPSRPGTSHGYTSSRPNTSHGTSRPGTSSRKSYLSSYSEKDTTESLYTEKDPNLQSELPQLSRYSPRLSISSNTSHVSVQSQLSSRLQPLDIKSALATSPRSSRPPEAPSNYFPANMYKFQKPSEALLLSPRHLANFIPKKGDKLSPASDNYGRTTWTSQELSLMRLEESVRQSASARPPKLKPANTSATSKAAQTARRPPKHKAQNVYTNHLARGASVTGMKSSRKKQEECERDLNAYFKFLKAKDAIEQEDTATSKTRKPESLTLFRDICGKEGVITRATNSHAGVQSTKSKADIVRAKLRKLQAETIAWMDTRKAHMAPKPSEEQVREIKQVFSILDKDENGMVELDQVKRWLSMAGMSLKEFDDEDVLTTLGAERRKLTLSQFILLFSYLASRKVCRYFPHNVHVAVPHPFKKSDSTSLTRYFFKGLGRRKAKNDEEDDSKEISAALTQATAAAQSLANDKSGTMRGRGRSTAVPSILVTSPQNQAQSHLAPKPQRGRTCASVFQNTSVRMPAPHSQSTGNKQTTESSVDSQNLCVGVIHRETGNNTLGANLPSSRDEGEPTETKKSWFRQSLMNLNDQNEAYFFNSKDNGPVLSDDSSDEEALPDLKKTNRQRTVDKTSTRRTQEKKTGTL